MDFSKMISFAEGDMSAGEFQGQLISNKEVYKPLYDEYFDCHRLLYLQKYGFSLYDYTVDRNVNTIYGRYCLQDSTCKVLEQHNIVFSETSKYTDDFRFSLNCIPSYLEGVRTEEYIDREILSKLSDDLSKTKKLQLAKQEIKRHFRWQKSFPHWIQAGEWPIVNNKPLLFIEQKRNKTKDGTDFYFLNEETGETAVVEQYY